MFRKKPVTVLGAGPAGLLAAHAAAQLGHDVAVFTSGDLAFNPKKSELHGCQYLHSWIGGLRLPRKGRAVRYLLEGPSEGYRRKVYGDAWQGRVSPDEFGPEEDHWAWDLRAAYDELWDTWYPRISVLDITPAMAERLSAARNSIVVSTIPAPNLCLRPDEHKFASTQVWAMGSTREDFATARSLPYYAPDFTVQCNGWKDVGWYRAATVFGQSTLEWPEATRPPVKGVASVTKPLSTDCDCHAGPNWHRAGRYGRWTKGVLVHTAYFDILEAL